MTTTDDSPTSDSAAEFEKPGAGTWNLDTGHFGADSSRICQDVIRVGYAAGSAEGFALMGAPLKQLDAEFVRGRFYLRMTPLVGGESDLPASPAPVLWLATRLHPAFRRAEKTAKRSLRERFWMSEHRRWVEEWRPHLESECRRFAATDVASLTDAQLADHLDQLYELTLFGATLHFRLHISDLGPIGLLLVNARDWGLSGPDVMMALSGHSPATNAPGEALAALRRIADEQPSPPTTLDEVRAMSPEARRLLEAFLEEYGSRLTTGYDIRALTLGEMPATILNAINTSASSVTAAASNAEAVRVGDEALAGLRDKVDPEHRSRLDQMVADARALYGLRDENGPVTYEWPAGILRRAVLEVSDRLERAGLLPEVGEYSSNEPNDTVFDLSAAEMSALLRGGKTPTISDVAKRARVRREGMDLEAPSTLGRVVDDPPLWTMPTNLRLYLDAIYTVLQMLEDDGVNSSTSELTGTGIGAERYVGRACVVREADEALANLEPGDVLVVPYTVPTYNAVLSIAGAVVTDSGGLLCHAAVIAREYGIPAVVGTGVGTTTIANGATVDVDPITGSVRVLTTDTPTDPTTAERGRVG